jgi:AhpD family alkylhydroperoxidase
MKIFFATLALSFLPIVASDQSVSAQDAPQFMKDVSPQQSASAAWQEYLAVFNPNGALDGKTKELIGLAVAAQIPCAYCIYAHTQGAKHAGATDAQIKEAIGAAALVRKWSTELNGNAYDMAEFKKQIDAAYEGSVKTQ